MKSRSKWVVGVDLDGTTLMSWDGKVDEFGKRIDRIHPLTKQAFKLMQDEGHVIVLDTGRNWYEAEGLYRQLNLNSFIINSAGAHIHNPNDTSFNDIIAGIPNELIKKILSDKKVSEHLLSWTVDDINDTYMKIGDSPNFIKNGKKFWKVTEFDGNFNFNPQSSVLYFDLDKKEINNLSEYLKSKYPNDVHITYWGTQDDGVFNGIELNPSFANKGTAILQVAKELGIPVENTMGIGDGENDIEMFKQTNIGVVMKNAMDSVKHLGNESTTLTNEEGGVGEYLIKKFNLKLEKEGDKNDKNKKS